MSNFFRKVAIVAIAVVTMCVTVQAQQKGDKAVGGNLVFGTGNSYTNFGIGAKFFYNITDPIRLAGEFDYFLKKDYVSWWDFSVYGHYLIPVVDQLVLYPSVGLGFVGWSWNEPSYLGYGGGSYSDNRFAVSLGGGADYALTPTLILNGELRIKLIENSNRFNLAVGIVYKF